MCIAYLVVKHKYSLHSSQTCISYVVLKHIFSLYSCQMHEFYWDNKLIDTDSIYISCGKKKKVKEIDITFISHSKKVLWTLDALSLYFKWHSYLTKSHLLVQTEKLLKPCHKYMHINRGQKISLSCYTQDTIDWEIFYTIAIRLEQQIPALGAPVQQKSNIYFSPA